MYTFMYNNIIYKKVKTQKVKNYYQKNRIKNVLNLIT